MNDFSAKTIRALARKGVSLVGLSCAPDAKGCFLNSTRLYVLNDNGTQRIRAFAEVLALAA